jgi:hypothetical protein
LDEIKLGVIYLFKGNTSKKFFAVKSCDLLKFIGELSEIENGRHLKLDQRGNENSELSQCIMHRVA